MSGIAGIYGRGSLTLIEKMLEAMAHRGPDGSGTFSDDGIFLGHNRLAIIDLTETGRQPMFNEDRSVVIVVNGEIYNATELRAGLEGKGHRFSSTSNSEVVLHLYKELGFRGMIRSLNGMFALALYDRKRKKLFLGRDRLGIKQLYFHNGGGRLAFASEIKAILRDREIPRELNPAALTQYLTFRSILNGMTFFQGIESLLPGHYLEYDGAGLRRECYWQPEFREETEREGISFEETCRLFREKTAGAVSRHLLSDVPVGTYISGGFDSSTVTYFAAKLLSGELESGRLSAYPEDRRLLTFTGKFEEGAAYDESPCSRALAASLGLDLKEVTIGPGDFTETIRDIIHQLDEPQAGVGAFSQYIVAREVARHIKVILSGHGGDEFFSGYPVFKVRRLFDTFFRNPAAGLGALTRFKVSELPHLAFFGLLPLFFPERKNGLFVLFDSGKRNRLLVPGIVDSERAAAPQGYLEDALSGFSGTRYQKLEWLYIKTYLSALFAVEDRISMAHSLETRTPLCDNEILDFAMSIPPAHKLHDHTLKAVIKYSMRGKLPEMLYRQPKKGFPTPLAKWIKGPLRELFQDTLSESSLKRSGIFDPREVQKMLRSLVRSPLDGPRELVLANRLWAVLNVEIWKDIFSVSV